MSRIRIVPIALVAVSVVVAAWSLGHQPLLAQESNGKLVRKGSSGSKAMNLQSKSTSAHAYNLLDDKVHVFVATIKIAIQDKMQVPVDARDIWVNGTYISGNPDSTLVVKTHSANANWKEPGKGNTWSVDSTSPLVDKISFRFAKKDISRNLPAAVEKAAGKHPLAYVFILAPENAKQRWPVLETKEISVPVDATDVDRIADAVFDKAIPKLSEPRGVLVVTACVFVGGNLIPLSDPIVLRLDATKNLGPK